MAELRPTDPVPTGLTPDVAGLQPAGTALRIDFGRAQAGVIDAVSRLLVSRPTDVTVQPECGAGTITAATWRDGLTLNFLDGDFVGWTLSEPGLVTAGGLAVGDTPPPVPMTDTTLGREFEIGGVWALLAEDSEEITTVWSGVTCFFR